MSLQEEKAAEYVAKAEKKLKAFSLFSGNKYDDAAELFEKGGNAYKMAKNWEEAGRAFERCSELHATKLDNKSEAAQKLLEAANCYKKTNTTKAVECFREAIDIFCDTGRFSVAAKHTKEVAELFEAEMDYVNAMEFYQKAADLFEGENAASSANACLLKIAQFASTAKDYPRAIELYEKVGRSSLDSNLLKWSAKDNFFKAGICRLAGGDYAGARSGIERYADMDPTFSDSREHALLMQLCDACDSQDVDDFTNAVYEYDKVSKLNSHLTTLLLSIKSNLKNVDLT